MSTYQTFYFYILGLLAFFALGYIFALIQAKIWSREQNQRSLNFQRGIVKGKISEQMAPYMPDFPQDLNVSEAKFLGSPVDFIVFKGMDEKNISEVVFVEVKSGKAGFNGNSNESSLKKAIDEKRVRYVPFRVNADISGR